VVDGRDDGINDNYLFDKRGVQVTPRIILSAEYQNMSRRAARAIMLSQAAKSDLRIQKDVMEQVADREAKTAAAQLMDEVINTDGPPKHSIAKEIHEEDEDVDMEGYS